MNLHLKIHQEHNASPQLTNATLQFARIVVLIFSSPISELVDIGRGDGIDMPALEIFQAVAAHNAVGGQSLGLGDATADLIFEVDEIRRRHFLELDPLER